MPARRSASAAGASPFKTGKAAEETAYGICSVAAERAGPERLPTWNRGHWMIENGNHHPRDASLGEDACRVRVRHAPANNAIMNNIVLAIVRHRGFRFVPEALDHFAMRREDAFDAVLSPGQPPQVHRRHPWSVPRFPAAAAERTAAIALKEQAVAERERQVSVRGAALEVMSSRLAARERDVKQEGDLVVAAGREIDAMREAAENERVKAVAAKHELETGRSSLSMERMRRKRAEAKAAKLERELKVRRKADDLRQQAEEAERDGRGRTPKTICSPPGGIRRIRKHE